MTEAQIQPMSSKEQHGWFLFLLSHEEEVREQLVKQIEYSSARGWYDPSDQDEKDELTWVEDDIAWLKREILRMESLALMKSIDTHVKRTEEET